MCLGGVFGRGSNTGINLGGQTASGGEIGEGVIWEIERGGEIVGGQNSLGVKSVRVKSAGGLNSRGSNQPGVKSAEGQTRG